MGNLSEPIKYLCVSVAAGNLFAPQLAHEQSIDAAYSRSDRDRSEGAIPHASSTFHAKVLVREPGLFSLHDERRMRANDGA